MFAPTRLFLSLRPHAAPALLASGAAVAALFASTPFLIPAVAERFDVSLGRAALISTCQVAGFATATFIAARTLSPARRFLVGAALTSVAANATSAAADAFALLLVLRTIAGVSAGVLVWLAWADAMKHSKVMRDVAAAGPMTALIAAPIVGAVASSGGDQPVYLILAVVAAPIAFLRSDFDGERSVRRKMSPSRSNVVLLTALGLLTMFGSSLFVFVASLGRSEVGMAAVTVAFAYSFNALSGFIGARLRAPQASAWYFVLLLGAAAATVAFVHHPAALFIGMGVWGFSFWMAVPDVLGRIADWSLVPEERVGDAQAVMALGRAAGPLIGAFFVGDGSYGTLGLVAVIGIGVVAIAVGTVMRYRRDRAHPMDRTLE